MMGLAGRVVLVTGARSGIGLGIAQAFARAGAQVGLASRDVQGIREAAAALEAEGCVAQGFAVDVTRRESVMRLCADVAERFGGIDVLCANAGIYPSAPLREMTEAQWDEVLDTNSKGSFFCVQAAWPYLAQSDQGRIVLTSSITGPVTGIPGYSHYGASKAAQLGFMRSAVMELAKDGITINAVLPGVILTDALAGLGEGFIAAAEALVPVRRLGTPADIANAAMFFASEASGFITGQTLIVDGGQILPETPDSL